MFKFLKNIFNKIFKRKEQGEVKKPVPFVEEITEEILPPAPPPISIDSLPSPIIIKEEIKTVDIPKIIEEPIIEQKEEIKEEPKLEPIKVVEVEFHEEIVEVKKEQPKKHKVNYIRVNGIMLTLPKESTDIYRRFRLTGDSKELKQFITNFLKGRY